MVAGHEEGANGQELWKKLLRNSVERRRWERMLEDTENWENIKEDIKSPEDKREQEKQTTDDAAERRGKDEKGGCTSEMRKGEEDGKWRGEI